MVKYNDRKPTPPTAAENSLRTEHQEDPGSWLIYKTFLMSNALKSETEGVIMKCLQYPCLPHLGDWFENF